jgi:hypothetical protein
MDRCLALRRMARQGGCGRFFTVRVKLPEQQAHPGDEGDGFHLDGGELFLQSIHQHQCWLESVNG